jgi:hypothetical protein
VELRFRRGSAWQGEGYEGRNEPDVRILLRRERVREATGFDEVPRRPPTP